MSNLDKARVERLLAELGQYLEERGESAQMYLVGGAAMALAYDRKRLTRDLDAVFIPKEKVYEAARVIAGRHDDLDEGWLNDAVKGLIPLDTMTTSRSSTAPQDYRSQWRHRSTCWR